MPEDPEDENGTEAPQSGPPPVQSDAEADEADESISESSGDETTEGEADAEERRIRTEGEDEEIWEAFDHVHQAIYALYQTFDSPSQIDKRRFIENGIPSLNALGESVDTDLPPRSLG